MWLETGWRPRAEVLNLARVFYDEFGGQLDADAEATFIRTGSRSWWQTYGFMPEFDERQGV
jgi:hypothetical protein